MLGTILYSWRMLQMSDKGKPEEGVVYCLIGTADKPSIANGNTWEESKVKE